MLEDRHNKALVGEQVLMVGCGPLRVLQRSEAIKAAFSQTVGRHMEERNG